MADIRSSAQDHNQDEIDLLNVLERLVTYIGRHKKLLIIAAIAGALAGAIIHLALPNEYNSRLILHSNILTNSEEIAIISNWSALLSNKEYDVLSKNLNCSPAILEKIKSLTADEIQNAQTTNSFSGFSVNVLVKDTAILEILQKAVIYGLENNEFVRASVEIKKANTIKIIENINHEIARLDSTKKQIENSNTAKAVKKATGTSSFIINISDVNVQMIELKEKLYEYQKQLKFIDAIQVLQKFEKYTKPQRPRLSFLMAFGFIGGLILGYILICYKYLSQKITLIREARVKKD